MTTTADSVDEYLIQARALVQELERGNFAGANDALDQLMSLREPQVYQELGKLTRTLHEALTNFQMDSRLVILGQQEIPDARNRLHYVVTKTEEAAHRTLKAVEDSIPLAKRLESRAADHQQQWDKFLRREMDVQEFRSLTRSLREFLAAIIADSGNLSRNLSEVLMAQEYQDLTGQVIQRVIKITQEVEDGLVEMVRMFGQRTATVREDIRSAGGGHGPQIDPKKPDVVANQDEVDDLLSSLGF